MNRRKFAQLSLAASTGLIISFGNKDIEIDSIELSEKRPPKTDTHMHLFGLDHLAYPWLKNAKEINKIFLPEDFIEATKKSNVTKIVFMESGAADGSSMKEVKWVIDQARKDSRIKGIIAKGKIEKNGELSPSLNELVNTGWVKGIRGNTPAEILHASSFTKSMDQLSKHNLTFDLLINPNLFEAAFKAIKNTPDTTFILDHLGNPDIQHNDFEFWKNGINQLASLPNINCKISGITTKAGSDWSIEMLKPYVYHTIEAFGFDRLVYGGDWPVVLRACSYKSWSKAFEKLTRQLSLEERHKIYHLNADRLYKLG